MDQVLADYTNDDDADSEEELMAMEFPTVSYDGAVLILSPDPASDQEAQRQGSAPGRIRRGVSFVEAMRRIDGPRQGFYTALLCVKALGVRLPRDLRVLLYAYVLRMWPIPVWWSSKGRLQIGFKLPEEIVFRIPPATLTPRFMRSATYGARSSRTTYRIIFSFSDAALAARLQTLEQWLLASVVEDTRKGFQSCVRNDSHRKGWILYCSHTSRGTQWTGTRLEGGRVGDVEDLCKLTAEDTTLALNQLMETEWTIHVEGISANHYRGKLLARLSFFMTETSTKRRLF